MESLHTGYLLCRNRDPTAVTYRPFPDGSVGYWQDFLPVDSAERYFRELSASVAWRQPQGRFFGRSLLIPRLTAWYGDPGAGYRYSGLSLTPLPWTPPLAALREQLEQATGACFNSVLLNLYRSGQDSVGWHADNEPELGERPLIASLSLGATRAFLLKHRSQPLRHRLELTAGSLLLMAGDTQTHWRHCVPKTRKPVSSRINLTFRAILTTVSPR